MAHCRTQRTLSLFMVLALAVVLLPTVQVLLEPPTVQAANSPLDILWSAPQISDTNSLAWGDVDGDGDLDLAVGNNSESNQLYRNQGGTLVLDATWNPAREPTMSVAWGDVDSDGDLDLLVGNYGSPNQLYRNQGGTLVLDTAWNPIAQATTSVAWGDVDGDGKLDLLVGNGDVNGITANQLYRNTNGTLVLDQSWQPAPQMTRSVAWGDVDGDGDLDLAVGNCDGIASNQLYRNQNGTLTLDATWNPPAQPTTGVAWGDVDGDGDLDLAVGNDTAANQLYRNRNGTLVFDPTWTPIAQNTLTVAWGDVDGDGDLDLVVGNTGRQPNQLYRNQGGTLVRDTTWAPVGTYTRSLAWGDVNGDGALDLVVGSGGDSIQLYQNRSTTLGLVAAWSPDAMATTRSLAWGDVNGDGALDLVVGNWNRPNQLYRNTGGTLVLDPAWNPVAQATMSVAWGDVDGDGDLDLIVGNEGAPNQLYRNENGTLSLDATWNPLTQPTLSVAWGDVDGDGDLDLAVGNNGAANQLYRNQNGTLVLDPTWNPLAYQTTSVAWGDVDGDGDLDLAVGNWGAPNQLYRNEHGTLSLDTLWNPAQQLTTSVAWGDVDGDGDLDLAIGNDGTSQLYRNQSGTLALDSAWFPPSQPTYSLAWGDVDGDGDLDLALGNNFGEASQLYRNQGGTLVRDTAWTPPGRYTNSLAWGDVDGDGTLDLALGNGGEASQLYRIATRSGHGLPTTTPAVAVRAPASADHYATATVRAAREIAIPFTLTSPHGDSVREVRAEYSLDGGGRWLPALPMAGTPTTALATLPERFPNNPTTPIAIPDATLASPGVITSALSVTAPANGTVGTVTAVAVELTLTHAYVGDVAATLTAPDGTVVNLFSNVGGSGQNITGLMLDDHAATSIVTATAPFSGTFQPAGSLAALNGKHPLGQWTLTIADTAPGATGALVAWALRLKTTGVAHSFAWDTFTSGVFGQSANVVMRLKALPALTSAPNSVPLFQSPYTVATTFPFRVRGTQVRVVDTQNAPQSGAMVFRLNDTLARDQQLFAPSANAAAYTTDALGLLSGRGELALGDQLIALAPVALPGAYADSYSQTLRLYATNILTTSNGVNGTPVATSGVQTVTVSLAHPLALFDLSVALEWDARADTRFMLQLQTDLARASELLFQSSHGQAALGTVTIFQDRENWDDANIRIYASNRVRPSAMIGGVAAQTVTDPASAQVVYGPGQVRMGAIWNRFGNANGNLSEDWPRTLVHELGHYLFFLEDNYLGLQGGQIIPVSSCPGLMSDTYAATWQFQTNASWDTGCAQTFSNQTTGRADWATIQTFYPTLVPPTQPLSTLAAGPLWLPLALTEITTLEPLTPTARLAVPIFYTKDSAGGRVIPALTARAYLFQHSHGAPSDTYTQLTPLGRAVNDQVLARGAHLGDRLCLFEPTAVRFGCETIRAGDEQLMLTSRPDWQPDIQVTPVTSMTLAVTVNGVPAGGPGLRGELFPLDDDPQPAPITLTAMADGSYQGTFALVNPLQGAYVHLQTTDGPTPTWETVTSFALGGNAGGFARTGGGFARTGGGFARTGGGFARTGGGFARTGGGFARTGGGFARTGGGFARTGGAPVSSAEGDVLLMGDNLTFTLGQFLLLQTTSSLPTIPAWATLIGQGYRFTTSPNAPDLTGSALSFNYLDSEVPAGEESGLQIYFRSPTGTAWQPITTTLDTYFNVASIPNQGPGLYAVMSSLVAQLTPGWNMVGYPSQVARQVPTALAPLAGKYRAVYGYNPSNPANPWELYSPDLPSWVNTPGMCMRFGQGYWIASTSATTETLRFRSTLDASEVTGCTTTSAALTNQSAIAPAQALGAMLPPATVYGTVTSSESFTATAGQPVVAWIGDTICGQGTTQLVDNQVVYKVTVNAASVEASACGLPGREVRLVIGDTTMGNFAWSNETLQQLTLTPETPPTPTPTPNLTFLPLVWR